MVMPVISMGTNLLGLGILVAVGIIFLSRILDLLKDYAGVIVALVGLAMIFAPEFLMSQSLIVGVFLVIAGIALATS
ncbi:hypothetical protein [Thermococcus sp. 4557]|uniref:hypothetical protein n=1 Tax=Thermococcus sp. (strain CGMCC 1.5172 / 4557) TaxID=1042877 RepID=UPI0011D2864B|nr:hypothetical protein [Thermococcus sp. 4557]